jgi:predicted MPP superfamily phosphohydrolase
MFAHMAARPDGKPDLILNTGDAVMAVDGKTSGAKAAEQIGLWKEAVKAAPAPILSCLGNHDVWDGHEPTADVPAEKKGFALMTEALGMPAPYYSVDRGGWHFVSLNSMCNWPKYAGLSPEHFDWLKADLAKTKLPTWC